MAPRLLHHPPSASVERPGKDSPEPSDEERVENAETDPLDLRVTDIWEVATFYSMLQTKPVGKYHIQICKTLSCKIMGEGKITEHVCNKLGIKPGETTADGKFTISLVECLGSCGTAPMFQLNFDYHENLTTERVDQILDSLP